MRRSIGVWLAAILLGIAGFVCADTFTLTCQVGGVSGAAVSVAEAGGENYLFLPSCARTEPLIISADADASLTLEDSAGHALPIVSGEPFALAGLRDGDAYTLTVNGGGDIRRVQVLVSANIRSLFILSNNPTDEGRLWLENCANHERYTGGRAVLLRADGSVAYDGALTEIRGRGNSTWWAMPAGGSAREGDYKRPYQIKLADKADLLDTGDPYEANRRWVLLADFFDGSMLRNRIGLDLALELGLSETSRNAPVDLYYDGEYRGTYLLAEKVEVGSGRVDVENYDEILQRWNEIGDAGMQELPQIESVNAYGDPFNAAAGVFDAGETTLGGYLIELDNTDTGKAQEDFTLQGRLNFTLQNPAYASESMVRYISGYVAELYATAANRGVHPETGAIWADYFDTAALLPYYWVNEWSKNIDTWRHSSTYFTLPEHSRKVRMGPVWDFDFAFYSAILDDGTMTGPTGLNETESYEDLGYCLLRIPEFRTLAARYYTDVVAPTVTQILLGEETAKGAALHSLAWYWQEEAASRRMNDVLWNPITVFDRYMPPTYEENYSFLRSYIETRTAWLAEETARWLNPLPLNAVHLSLTANYGNAAATLRAAVAETDAGRWIVYQTYTLDREATKMEFAQWRGGITVAANIGYKIADGAALFINDAEIPYRTNGDGSVSVSARFEDISYRPAVYDEADYGLVFDAPYYAEHYPDIAAAVGNDGEELLRYYVEHGAAQGQAANAFFDPREVLSALPQVRDMLGDDYEAAVFFFIEAGYLDWMSWLGKTFAPQVLAAE